MPGYTPPPPAIPASVPPTRRQAGRWFVTPGMLRTTSTGNTENRLSASALMIESACTVTQLAAQVVTASATVGAVVRLGIYADSNGAPGALLVDAGTIPADVAAVGTLVLGTPLMLTPGRYWLAAVAQLCGASPPSMACSSNTSAESGAENATTALNFNVAGLSQTSQDLTTGALPATFPPATQANGVPIRVAVLIA